MLPSSGIAAWMQFFTVRFVWIWLNYTINDIFVDRDIGQDPTQYYTQRDSKYCGQSSGWQTGHLHHLQRSARLRSRQSRRHTRVHHYKASTLRLPWKCPHRQVHGSLMVPTVFLICADFVQIIIHFLPVIGAYIKGRFAQKDLEQKAVRYVIPADIEVTADSFEFQVTDPAGNTMLPEVYISLFA